MSVSKSGRVMVKDDLFRLEWLQAAKLSPEGKRLVYTVTHIIKVKDEEEEFSRLYLLDIASGETRQMTSDKQNASAAAWSPDGKTIAFVSDRDEKPQIYLLPVDGMGGEAQPLTDMKQGAIGPFWSPDGRKIAFTAPIDYGDNKPPDRDKQPYRVNRNVWRFDAIGDIDMAVNNLYVIDVKTKDVTQLTDDNLLISRYDWHPDSERLLVSSILPAEEWYGFKMSTAIIDLSGNVEKVKNKNNLNMLMPTWTTDGKRIAFIGEDDDAIIGTHNDLWTLDLESGELSNRTPGLERSLVGGLEGRLPALRYHRPFVGIDEAHVYVQVQDGGTVAIYRISLDGDPHCEKLIHGPRTCMLLDKVDDTLLYSVDDITHTPNAYIAKTDGSGEQQLTHINEEFLAKIIMPEVVNLHFPGSDGVEVEGWYVKPTNGAQAPYPTILWIHGGPHGAQGNRFAFDTHMFNGAGYGVLFINHRASTGYGNAFSTAIHGDWGNLDYNDLMAGVDHAIQLGLADADKLGCSGISGGGNLSCWIVGNTDRFKAAVPQNPLTNWVSFYGVSDIGVWFGTKELGGHPHEIPEIYSKCSPITYAHNCKTPTLMIQTEHDWRCPAEQSEQFYTVLRANGCTVEMLRQPKGSHSGSIFGGLPLRRENLSATLHWFDKYIMEK
jgi:dipeptidyl aminopeptidase/acylaminoacyl peptidase